MGYFKCIVPLVVLVLVSSASARPGIFSEGRGLGTVLDPLGLFHHPSSGSSASADASSKTTSLQGGFHLGPIGFSGSINSASANAHSNAGSNGGGLLGGGGASSEAVANANAFNGGGLSPYGGGYGGNSGAQAVAQANANSFNNGRYTPYGGFGGNSGSNAQASANSQAGGYNNYYGGGNSAANAEASAQANSQGHVRGIRSACATPDAYAYNRSYPLTPSVRKDDEIKFSIGMISDLDEESRQKAKKDLWRSHLKKGQLTWHPLKNEVSVKWDKGLTTFSTTLNMKGRGMEFSELVTFDGRLLTFDDRTGVIYFFEGDNAYPWVILMDGNGKSSKGFKAEWATVKDNLLYVGSTGKEKTTSKGEFVSNDPYWIKVVSPRGEVQAYNWTSNYKRLAKAIDIEPPGYVIHESGVWSDTHRKWFFLPRRCSKEKYNKDKNESRSCNVLLIANETFENVQAILIGGQVNVRGFSSFKFLPGTNDTVIVALKTKELENDTATYITVFNIEGKILMPDLKVDNDKYEGLEFL